MWVLLALAGPCCHPFQLATGTVAVTVTAVLSRCLQNVSIFSRDVRSRIAGFRLSMVLVLGVFVLSPAVCLCAYCSHDTSRINQVQHPTRKPLPGRCVLRLTPRGGRRATETRQVPVRQTPRFRSGSAIITPPIYDCTTNSSYPHVDTFFTTPKRRIYDWFGSTSMPCVS